ncbi:hypothetical protein CANINC_001567 [Pichia inconspicua]|uniref:Nucleoporin Nup133/Nup155-like N-terminal domain-containing protein n=1 Tax=Pichia inconspicua TaxID=52247 RepID=A0A4T0X514_9ASCO|nr:hypothetical protein CANINC_001567 [[Candida] inconspicua]
MVSINFSAKRFNANNPSTSADTDTVAQIDNSELRIDEQSNVETLLDDDYLRVTLSTTLRPPLEDGETILDTKANTSKIATIITTKRIFVYNYRSKRSQPYYFECSYTPNKFNLLPLCVIIPNSVYEMKPDLIVLDPVSGLLKFYESVKMEPSLGGLQNIKTFHIKVNNAEFLTDLTLLQHSDLLLSTSQCRVLYIKLRDHLRDSPFNYFEIYNNRSLVSFMLSKSYSIREYHNFNRIVSLKLYDVSPVEKYIVILESSGRLSFIKHLIGSTSFTLERTLETNMLLNVADAEYLDFELSVKKQFAVLLLRSRDSSPCFGLAVSLGKAFENCEKAFKFDFPYVSDSKEHTYPKIFFAKDDEVCILECSKKLLVFEPQFENLSTAWAQIVTLKETLEIFSIEKVDNNTVYLNTNDGYISIEVKKSGTSHNQNIFMEQHIIQYLKYGAESNSITYDLKGTGVMITQTVLKNAIRKVSDNLITNSWLVTGTNASDNLKTRLQYFLKLIKFTSENCDMEDAYNLKSELVTNCQLISLANGLFQMSFEKTYAESIQNSLSILNWEDEPKLFFLHRTKEIVALLEEFINSIVNSCAGIDFLHLAESLSTLFESSYIECDQEIKKYFNQTGLCNVFSKHHEVIKNVNIVTRKVYEIVKEDSSDLNKTGFDNILMKLTCFLYCVTSETVLCLSKAKNSSDFEDLNRFLIINKENWTNMYILSNRQSEMIPLALQYNDMQTLAILMESKRELCSSINDDNLNLLDEGINEEFDYYFDSYGYNFAEALFRHYLVKNKIDVMLSYFPKQSEFLEKFLSSDIRLYRFGWIHDAQMAAFDRVCDKLLKFMSDPAYSLDNSLEDKKLQSSFGKLSAICNKGTSNNSAFEQFSCSLRLVLIQNEIYEVLTILEHNDNGVLKNTLSPMFDSLFWNIHEKLRGKRPLTLTEIINFVTMCSFEPALSASTDGMEDDDKVNSCEEFIVSVSAKIFRLLENFKDLDCKHGDGTMRELWIKLLIRRLLLRNDKTKILSKVINTLKYDVVEGYLHDLKSLELQQSDLNLLGLSEQNTFSDYIKENETLRETEIFKSM